MAEQTDQAPPELDAPILDLATLVKRPRIAVDGKTYEILSPDELSIMDGQRFAAWGRRIDQLMAAEELAEAQQTDLADTVRKLTDQIMVGVPAEVREKLSDAQRLSIAEVFTLLPLGRRLTSLTAAAGNRATRRAAASVVRSTGATSSPGSSGSSAAARPAG